MYCLLRGSTLAIDRHARHGFRQAGCQRRRAGDISGLGPDVVQAAEDDIVDRCGVHVVSTHHSA